MSLIKNITRKFAKSRTLIFGLVVTVLGAVEAYLPNVQTLLDPTTYGITIFVIGIAIMVLRFLTTTSIASK